MYVVEDDRVTPVGKADILGVPVPIVEGLTDKEFVRLVSGVCDMEPLFVCVFELVVLSEPVFVMIVV